MADKVVGKFDESKPDESKSESKPTEPEPKKLTLEERVERLEAEIKTKVTGHS